jgi:hypothetical protein
MKFFSQGNDKEYAVVLKMILTDEKNNDYREFPHLSFSGN